MRDKKKSSDTKNLIYLKQSSLIIFSFKSFPSTSRLCLLKQKHISAFCTSLLVTTIFKGFFVGNKKKGIQRQQKVYADVVKNHRSFITLDSLLPPHPCPSPPHVSRPTYPYTNACSTSLSILSILSSLPSHLSLTHSLPLSLRHFSHPIYPYSLSHCLSVSLPPPLLYLYLSFSSHLSRCRYIQHYLSLFV